MLSIATGYNPRYLTGEVANGGENYYTREVGRGEPPGIWQGRGTAPLGLIGPVDEQDMEGVYVHFVDPRDPAFRDGRRGWRHAARLGRPPRKYATAEELLAEALAREPDAEPERVEELKRASERRARTPVAFLDLTFGVPKSFSILHTALRAQEVRTQEDRAHADGRARTPGDWTRKIELLERAIWAGNTAALEYLQDHAGFSRAGYHGARTPTGGSVGRWIDAHAWVVASFLQHTSRAEDMHLHIHNAVLNRVECADGRWRTLDSRAIHRMRGAAGAIAERVMTEQAIKTLGVQVRWSEDGHTLELVGVSVPARRLFSRRRRDVTTAVKDLVARFEQRRSRPPNALELSQLAREASKATRAPKKRHKESLTDRLDRWERQLRSTVDESLAQIAAEVPDRVDELQPDAFSPAEVIAQAVEQVQATKASWTRFDLIRALNSHLPACLGGLGAVQVVRLLDELADRALNPDMPATDDVVLRLNAPDLIEVPTELRLNDGRSVFEAPAETVYATRGHIAAEESLVRAVARRAGALTIAPADVDAALARLAEQGTELGADQATVIRGLLTATEPVVTVVGPAGTGKSFVMGMTAQLWQHHTSRSVIGLATGQRAAAVLAEEGFTRTDNVDRWLQRQARLDAGSTNSPDLAARLQPGDLVVLDEASMSSTSQVAAIVARCAHAGARLIVVGDERQLGAVGAGGAFRLMTNHGRTFTLDEVRRFAAPWERAASLRLRDADPNVLSVYERHGRIVDGGSAENAGRLAARAWLADTLGGYQSLLVVGTGEQAAELSARLRTQLVDLGRVSADGVELHHRDAEDTVAGVGDIIQTRRNDWRITDSYGRAVINRDMWQVTSLLDDGGLRVRRITGHHNGQRELGPELDLPAAYVAHHVTLGYAVTVHSAQGSTVDTCYPIITSRTDTNAFYVAMTRGRVRSVAHVATDTLTELAPTGPEPTDAARRKDMRPSAGQILAAVVQRDQPDLAAVDLREQLAEAAGSLPVLGSRWAEANALAVEARYWAIVDDLTADSHLDPRLATQLLADEAVTSLWRLVRGAELAGHDPRRLLDDAATERELWTAESVAKVLHHRITARHGDRLLPTGDTWTARTPTARDPISQYAVAVAAAMDARCTLLGGEAAARPPTWSTRLGPIPDNEHGRREWIRRAGVIAGFREQYQITDDTDPIGGCPKPGLPEARAAWFAAWRALGEPNDLAAETTMTVPALVAAVETYTRQQEWAPAWVADGLRDQSGLARWHEQEAHLKRAEAAINGEEHQRRQLYAQADEHLRTANQLFATTRDLTLIDEARAAWHAHTDHHRQAAKRAVIELRRRGLDTNGQRAASSSASTASARPTPDGRAAIAYPTDLGAALAKARVADRRVARETANGHGVEHTQTSYEGTS
ncbi:MobF family relaxase [Hamadaea tsunoensis]|uniref:MobF family relaxase n=1 Tax=Hamadaea tsunoensis TaxID=53368 RepID=UPI0004170085|nr:MobF family relaxase [Hamadaea tsunoensis]